MTRLSKIFEFDLDTGTRQFKTWVYSDTGTDIEKRFTPHKVSNIKEKTPIVEETTPSIPDSWSDLEK